jgi:hypothetical protein
MAIGSRHKGIAKINHRLLSAAADSSVEELILALQADEFVVLLVGEVRSTFTDLYIFAGTTIRL